MTLNLCLKKNHFQKDSANFQQGLVTLKIQVLQLLVAFFDNLVADMKNKIKCIFNQYSKLYLILDAQSEIHDLN